jgi:mannitol/fructose-specific phosphotransferase system IIA component (Ntr-type)
MTLSRYTTQELMIPRLRSRDAAAIIAELCSVMHREQRVKDLLPFYNDVISRETLSSTATSPGWAMPHARGDDLERLSFAVGLTAEPLTWFGDTGELVSVVFLFAVPESETASYLRLLSGFSRLSRDPLIVQRLLQASDSRMMFDLLEQIPLRRPRPAAAELTKPAFS